MEWIASLDFEKIANAIIILLTGFLAAFGFRKRGATEAKAIAQPAVSTVELAGALVDSASVKALAGSIEGHSLALIETRAESREVRACLGKVVDAIEDHTRAVLKLEEELQEVRGEMRTGRR